MMRLVKELALAPLLTEVEEAFERIANLLPIGTAFYFDEGPDALRTHHDELVVPEHDRYFGRVIHEDVALLGD
jgi:hypothetical protein